MPISDSVIEKYQLAMMSHPLPQDTHNTVLFVGNLSVFATSRDLFEHFKDFGEIEDIRLKPGRGGQNNCGFGFVEFRSRSSAIAAIAALHGNVFMGRIIRVQWASSAKNPTPKCDTLKSAPAQSSIQVLVSFASRRPRHIVNEEELRIVFSQFGAVVDVAIKRSRQMQKNGLHSGYCFVAFENSEVGLNSAMHAIERMHNTVVGDVVFDCRMSDVLRRQLEEHQQSQIQQQYCQQPPQYDQSASHQYLILPPNVQYPMQMASSATPMFSYSPSSMYMGDLPRAPVSYNHFQSQRYAPPATPMYNTGMPMSLSSSPAVVVSQMEPVMSPPHSGQMLMFRRADEGRQQSNVSLPIAYALAEPFNPSSHGTNPSEPRVST